MANETRVDEFLGDLTREESDPFDNKSPDILPTNQTEEIQEEEEPKVLPFHKDPKVQKYIEREIAKRIPEQREPEVEETTTDIDEVLTRIIGNDTPEKISAIKDFKRVILEREDRGAEKALNYLQSQREAEDREEQEADDELESGFEAIEDNHGVDITSDLPQARKLRGEFINFIRKVAPKNSDGEVIEFPDFEQTFEVFQSTRETQTNNRAKELANRSTERGSNSFAPNESEDKSWSAVDRIISKLTGG